MTFDPRDPMHPTRPRPGIPFSGRLVFGLVLLTLGVLWTADNLGVLDADAVLRWWPVLLLAFGLTRLFGIQGQRSVVSGALFSLIGLWMLLRELGIVHVSIFRLWPLFMIFVGAALIWRSTRGSAEGAHADRATFPRPFAFMGGVVRNIESQDLVGIEATAVMGGVELDLRNARARGREVVVETFTWWGGIELIVPEDWQVANEVTPIMGGVEDKSRYSGDGTTTLVVRGLVVMGGVEIKNARTPGEFRGVRVGIASGGPRRKEVRVDATGVTITREDGPSGPASPPPTS